MGWVSLALWMLAVPALVVNHNRWHWQILVPLASTLELSASPVFPGLKARERFIFRGAGRAWIILIAALAGYLAAVALVPIAAAVAIGALHVRDP